MADTASFSAAMKDTLIGPIRDAIPKGKVLLFGDADANPTDFKGIVSSAENIDMVGNEWRIPQKVRRNQAVGFRNENGRLPAPGSGQYTYQTEPLRFAYCGFNITGPLIKASETGDGAFVPAFKQETEDSVLSCKIMVNRAAYGDGSGKLATLAADAALAATTVDLVSTINFRGYGEVIDFVQADGTVLSAAHEVTAVDRTAKTITISPGLGAAVTAAAGFPVLASSDSTTASPNNSQNKEIQGLGSIVSNSGTLHGLNPVTYSFWKSTVTAVNGAISDAVLRAAKDQIGFESGVDLESGIDYAILTTRGIRANYAQTLMSLKRFTNVDAVKLHGGYTALMFDENPIFIDDQCPVGTVFGLALNKMLWIQASDWEWMEEDGNVLHRDPNYDRYTAMLFKYCQLGTTQRNAHFKLTGVTDDDR